MKSFIVSFILVSIFLTSCDQSEYFYNPEVVEPNQNYNITHFINNIISYNERKTESLETKENNDTIYIKRTFITDKRSEMICKPYVINGNHVEIDYIDTSTKLKINEDRTFEITSLFLIKKRGTGTGNRIKLISNFRYPSGLNVNSTDTTFLSF
ncbi:MAG: hypothetical protein MUE53_00640 [Chitinophagales bacterium]|jgi:hypothetical protein|nr:hypothetical protein [Chitinophagales bacterium]